MTTARDVIDAVPSVEEEIELAINWPSYAGKTTSEKAKFILAALEAAGISLIQWQPIETAPVNTWVTMWWTPVTANKHAEACIIGQVSTHKPGTYWDGMYGDNYQEGYKPLERITHWMPLPEPPRKEP